MSSVAIGIIEDIVEVLRATDKFRLVTVGDAGSETDIPRASVIYEGQESFLSDDSSSVRWVRLCISVNIHTRSLETTEAVTRVDELCKDAINALEQDPYRGQRCWDLPIGRATEVSRNQLVRGIKRPEAEMTLEIRCHLEVEVSS